MTTIKQRIGILDRLSSFIDTGEVSEECSSVFGSILAWDELTESGTMEPKTDLDKGIVELSLEHMYSIENNENIRTLIKLGFIRLEDDKIVLITSTNK